MISKKLKVVAIAAVGFALVTGCGQKGDERLNDAGPPIELNKEGPGPMMPPSEGTTTLPEGMQSDE